MGVADFDISDNSILRFVKYNFIYICVCVCVCVCVHVCVVQCQL